MIRRSVLLLLVAGACVVASAQGERTTTIKRKETGGAKEQFEVLRSDTSVRHGEYQRTLSGAVIEEGHYTKGQRSGEWLFRDRQAVVIAQGNMNGDDKTGQWKYFTSLGEPVQTVDHDKDSLLWFDPEAERRAGFGAPIQWPDTSKEQLPIFLGGMSYMGLLVIHNTHYPESERDQGREGRVLVKFIVDKEGHTDRIACADADKPAFCAAAERAIAALGNNWIPARQLGDPVTVQFQLPVNFKLQ